MQRKKQLPVCVEGTWWLAVQRRILGRVLRKQNQDLVTFLTAGTLVSSKPA